MTEKPTQDIESVQVQWNEHAEQYDDYYESFEGALEHHVDMEILQRHLPEHRSAKILDAAGGTGRIALPLAKMGYRVSLCDVASGMLAVAKEKMTNEGVADRVQVTECDITNLPFADESFDMVICWDGMSAKAAQEIVRVTRKAGGKLSLFLVNRLGSALSEFRKSPTKALDKLRTRNGDSSRNIDGYAYEPLSFSPDEARSFFQDKGIKVHDVYAVCGMLKMLQFSAEIRNTRDWDEKLFTQTAEMLMRLSSEPSVKGLAWHLVLYGECR
jgi:S-adenosylmethionine-dependent methyltransferase